MVALVRKECESVELYAFAFIFDLGELLSWPLWYLANGLLWGFPLCIYKAIGLDSFFELMVLYFVFGVSGRTS